MTSFTFTPEQVRTAPPEVRNWMVRQIMQALSAGERPSHDPAHAERAALSACSVEEALQIFNLIRGDFVLTQVFFEIARDPAPGRSAPSLHILDVGELLHHTRLHSGEALVESLEAINAAFREIHHGADATLFGFDDHGHVYVRQETHLSVRQVWEQLTRTLPQGTRDRAPPATMGFAAPHLGPSQDVASHAFEQPTGDGIA